MFFFNLISTINGTFEGLFDQRRASTKPIAPQYQEFTTKWGWIGTSYSLGENLVEIEKVREMYLTTVLTYLSYKKDEAIAQKAQDDLEEQIRKARQR